MLEIKNTQVFNLERSLLSARNSYSLGEINTIPENEDLGPKVEDIELGIKLGSAKSGSGHETILSGITVVFDIKYPEYWSPEAQRYHWFQILMSQSKIHKITSLCNKEEFNSMFNKYVDEDTKEKIKKYCENFNNKVAILDPLTFEKHPEADTQYYWFMKIISNLPMGFEKWMTVATNYLQLKTIYFQRKNHKLKEDWKPFCDWCLTLPYFKQLIGLGM